MTRLTALVKKLIFHLSLFFFKTVGKFTLSLLFKTCRLKVEGLEDFKKVAENKRCILMLWHNRLAIIPCILDDLTPNISYAAMVSASRDGKLLKAIVDSYKNGRTIRVGHQARYKALRELIRHVEERQHIVVITPDGPRGPCYEIKSGIAVAAIETQATIVALNWEAKRFWQFSTWDRLRFPKPFTTITASFTIIPAFTQSPPLTLEDAKKIIKETLERSCV
jgi:lysophospholipid acyltransferase (LPLAT)-like uncharacterized protein